MKRLRKILVIFLLLFMPCTVVFAADDAMRGKGICTYDDLTGGTWKLVQLVETPELKEAALYGLLPYQYLTFHAERNYAFAATSHEVTTQSQLKKVMEWPQKKNRVLHYLLDKAGVLDLYVDRNIIYRYRCVIVRADEGDFKKNDLILTAYTQGNQSQLYKLYRRWY